jgi:glycerol-3-phosphate dehydrogenase (NAD(P)+)
MKKFYVKNEKIGILGSGSWGTTLGILLSNRHHVKMWEFDIKQFKKIVKNRENKKFLPGVKLPKNLNFTNDINEVIIDSDIIIIALPSHTIRNNLKSIKKQLKNKILICVSKGIENKTLNRMSEVIYDETNNSNIFSLSGPSHAEEVSNKIPTTVVIAPLKKNTKTLKRLQNIFMTEHFRVYTNDDIIGVELGGSVKNIIAIAAGISDGLGFGANTKAALMTRGMKEIQRLGIKMGAKADTFSGLAGIGDLITTCISHHSRNRFVGEELGKGRSIKTILNKMVMIAEGVKTTKSVYNLAKKFKIEMPITEQVYKILYRNGDPKKAVKSLMLRQAKSEKK